MKTEIRLKPGRDKPLRQRHPWVFSGAIAEGSAEPGGLVNVVDKTGAFLGKGTYNPHSQIRVRIMSWDQDEQVDAEWWAQRLEGAIQRRRHISESHQTNAARLVHAESDGLPGLIVDQYDDILVMQALTLGVEQAKSTIVDALVQLLNPRSIYERSDADARQKEGLAYRTGLLYGEEVPKLVMIAEANMVYPVDIVKGHKTGFYLDQRAARAGLIWNPNIQGGEILNAFSYSGSLGICAASNQAAHITHIDSSEPALELARQAIAANSQTEEQHTFVAADVFEQFRHYRDQGRQYDVVILDPPKFAHSARQVERAARGYKDINLLAFQLLRPGGILYTFSCSGQVSADLFQKIVFGASVDAERDAQIMEWFDQPADHPVLLSFPEGRYLKGLACRVVPF
ncbi:MAG: class I SAM-dependent rRNA methyltransferase [Chloroflexi bacterium]|nr:class I SAM-dependent rRNA methyltransferase [Chloroflexota bacterium]